MRRRVKERGYTALIDRAGRLVGRAGGPRPWDTPAARQLVEALLAEPPPR